MPTNNINIKVTTPGITPIRFSTNANPIVIKNDALIATTKLRALEDVVIQDQADGNTLVYNAENETFVLESPNNLNITDIDGGSF